MALLSGGTSLAGLLMGPGKNDSYQQYMRQLQTWLNPGQINQDQNAFYKQFLASPAFAQGQNANIQGANVLQNQLAGRLGQSGLGASGIGQAAQSMAQSSLGPMMSKLYAGGWQSAGDMAGNLARMRVSGIGGAPAPNNMAGGLLASGLSGIGDVLKLLYQRQQAGKGNVPISPPMPGSGPQLPVPQPSPVPQTSDTFMGMSQQQLMQLLQMMGMGGFQ